MSRIGALVLLLANFIRGSIGSGLFTARVILRRPGRTVPGLARLSYGGLSEQAAAVVGVLVTLTPGTTVVDIDLTRRELLLHLLDLGQREATLEAVEREFLAPMHVVTGVRR